MELFFVFILAVYAPQIIGAKSSENITICKTPNLEPGYCVPLMWCPQLLKALATYGHSLYFENAKCGDFKVCCAVRGLHNSSQSIDGYLEDPLWMAKDEFNKTAAKNRDFALNKYILPLKPYCGLQHADDRLYSEDETALDEAPWLVNFVAQYALAHRGPPKKDNYYAYCAGVLITREHVLSSSYCSVKRYYITAARLGQYHPRQNVSCVSDSMGEKDCTQNFVDIPIEKFLRLGDSNFFIYKLAQKVSFTDFIRHICLPFNDTKRPTDGDLVISSGWGDYAKALIAKKRLVHKIVNEQQCDGFNDSVRFGKINRKYGVCAQRQDSSNANVSIGDQGGPLAFSIKNRWYLEGIVNYVRGDYVIGEKITPQILDWILDALYHFHVKPSF